MNRKKTTLTSGHSMTFAAVVEAICKVNEQLQFRASHAVNLALTIRNWLIGHYISEYELHGADRAKYGDGLLSQLSVRLTKLGVSNCDRRQLYRYLAFSRLYPAIVGTVSPQLPLDSSLSQSSDIVGTLSPQSIKDAKVLLENLSYSHFEELLDIEEPKKRAFYEVESIRSNWSLRELRRQIGSLYYERTILSKNKKKLSSLTKTKAEIAKPEHAIRDPYIFEFLGLKPKQVVSESHLEDSLLDKLEEFLLELGHGFCFEARQKRILLDNEHFFVDLVFYHRILKCHVLLELKTDEFKHEYLGQLNTYVSWFRENQMSKGDSPPVGILLCTKKKHSTVRYALAGVNNKLFVSKYQLELPKKEEIERFLDKHMKEVELPQVERKIKKQRLTARNYLKLAKRRGARKKS